MCKRQEMPSRTETQRPAQVTNIACPDKMCLAQTYSNDRPAKRIRQPPISERAPPHASASPPIPPRANTPGGSVQSPLSHLVPPKSPEDQVVRPRTRCQALLAAEGGVTVMSGACWLLQGPPPACSPGAKWGATAIEEGRMRKDRATYRSRRKTVNRHP